MAKNRVIPFGYCMKNGVITTDPQRGMRCCDDFQ